MNQYKFRAECRADVAKMMGEAPFENLSIQSQHLQGMTLPDVEVSFSSSLELEDIRGRLDEIPDGHVMKESLNLEKDYTGERLF